MPDDAVTTLRYVGVAAATAATLFYVFGPSLLPDETYSAPNKHNAVGLSNPANDCFINSVLQALSASAELRTYLRNSIQIKSSFYENEKNASSEENRDEAFEPSEDESHIDGVMEALAVMLERLSDPSMRGHTTSAKPFIHALERAYHSRLGRQQQDAQEFLQLVVQKLADEMSAQRKLAKDNGVSIEPLPLPIEGKIDSQIECLTCRYRRRAKSTVFLTLSLNVPQRGATTLDECLDGLLKQEVIDDFVCDQCKLEYLVDVKSQQLRRAKGHEKTIIADQLSELERARRTGLEEFADGDEYPNDRSIPRRRIVKNMSIAQYPTVLLLHLSRSVYGLGSSKNNAKVHFDEHLRLGSFERQDYRLVSVVCHRGGHNSGHYETFRRRTLFDDGTTSQDQASLPIGGHDIKAADGDKRRRRQKTTWWGISDDHVRECQLREVLDKQQACYLLFYEKTSLKSGAS